MQIKNINNIEKMKLYAHILVNRNSVSKSNAPDRQCEHR